MSWDSEGDSSSVVSSLDRVHLVPPQLTTLHEAIFVGEAIIPDSIQNIKSNAHGGGQSERFMFLREEIGTLTRHSWLRE